MTPGGNGSIIIGGSWNRSDSKADEKYCVESGSDLKIIRFPFFAGILLLFRFLCLNGGNYLGADIATPTHTDLRERFQQQYSCPGDNGIGTFSAKVSSVQLTEISRQLRINEPSITLFFLDPEIFDVEIDQINDPKARTGGVKDCAEAIGSAVEGFFRYYLMIGYSNLLKDLPASATIRISGGNLMVDYFDKHPNQTVSLTFDSDFRLKKFETGDSQQGFRSVLLPSWDRIKNRFVLASLDAEYYQRGVEKAGFISRMKIENHSEGNFILPGRVTMQVREETDGKASNTFLDFYFGPYQINSPERKE